MLSVRPPSKCSAKVVVSASPAEHGMTVVDVFGTAPLAVRQAVRDRALS
jgi:hypothetical protein